jgi:cytoskeletal protein CcmA (bactofilin family)
VTGRHEHGAEERSTDRAVGPDDETAEKRRSLPSLIGYTVVMKGELSVGEDLIIEGTFDGTITGDGHDSVTVRRIARLSGQVSASDLRVEDGADLQKTVLSGRIRLADEKHR